MPGTKSKYIAKGDKRENKCRNCVYFSSYKNTSLGQCTLLSFEFPEKKSSDTCNNHLASRG